MIEDIEQEVAAFYRIERAALFSMPEDPKIKKAYRMLLLTARDYGRISISDLAERYYVVSTAFILRNLYETYSTMKEDDDIQYAYKTIAKKLGLCITEDIAKNIKK